jgi:hypothetical protein
MFTNFILAVLLISLAFTALVTLDRTTSVVAGLIKSILRFTRRSKLLTEYILRAYMRYRKAISKPIIHNA